MIEAQTEERNADGAGGDRETELFTFSQGQNGDIQRLKWRRQTDGQCREAECHRVIGGLVLLACVDQCLKREQTMLRAPYGKWLAQVKPHT